VRVLRPFLGAALLGVVAGLVPGCTVGPNFRPSRAPDVTSYDANEVSLPQAGDLDPQQRLVIGAEIVKRWWELLQSPPLNDIIVLALSGSPPLAGAIATLAQAQEAVVQAKAAYYPQLDLGANASRQHVVKLGSSSVGSGLNISNNGNGSSFATNIFSFGPLLTYSPDFFGHTRRTVEQQIALADNERYQLAAAYLSLTAGTVAQAVTIASILAQIKAAEEIVAVDVHNLELVRIEFEAGSIARTDVLTAESQLAGDETLLPPLRQQLSVARHALSVLVGVTPAQWSPPDFELDTLTLPIDLPVTVPSQLIHDRPDILAAEGQLHAASAAIGIATAQLYPSVNVSASTMFQAVASNGPFSPGILLSLAGGITQPLFHGDALLSQRRAAIDAFEVQFNSYRQVVLVAFGQIADTLRALEHDAELLEAQRRAVTTSEASLALSQEAYAAGRGSLLQVLDSQRLFSQAVLGYARAKGQRYLDTVQLFQAMGGASLDWLAQTAASSR